MSTSTTIINQHLSDEIIRLNHAFGNLLVHVSGEGKVDFRAAGQGSGWLGMIKVIYSGDTGCMKPYKGYDTCAFNQAIEFLMDLDMVPHMNLGSNEEYTVTPETWRKFVQGIEEECSFVGSPKKKYVFELKQEDGDKVITTIVLEPLCNEFVVGEVTAAKHCELIGIISDYDQPLIKSCFIVAEEKEYKIELENLIHFRHRKFIPRKGDYLLRHHENENVYIVLPQEDYSIH